jgi:hypothetical protein
MSKVTGWKSRDSEIYVLTLIKQELLFINFRQMSFRSKQGELHKHNVIVWDFKTLLWKADREGRQKV